MPLYEYRCAACGHDLEAIQKFSDAPLTDCPACGAPKLEKLLSQSSFALKGGGWYADGYGPNGAKKDDEASKKTSESASEDSKSSDTKSGDGKSKETKSGESKSSSESPKKPEGSKASNA